MNVHTRLASLALAVAAGAATLTGAPNDASAMDYYNYDMEGGGGGGGGYYPPPPPAYANKVVYLHGRSQKIWPAAAAIPTGGEWNHVRPSYNGNSRLHDAHVRSIIKETIHTNCNAPNQCVILAYSSGTNRMLLALSDLAAEGRSPNSLLWVTSTASASGGSEVAVAATRGFTGFITKLFGERADIDYDITPNVARGTYGYTQNASPAAVYHLAGNRDYCKKKKILFVKIKICGKKYLPGRYGDGAVAPHSACGLTTVGAFSSCAGTKYANRYAQQDALYWNDNHETMVAAGVRAAAGYIGYTATISSATTSDDQAGEPEGDVSYDDGDDVGDTTLRFGQTAELAEGDTYAANEHAVRSCASGDCSYASPAAGGSGGSGGTSGGAVAGPSVKLLPNESKYSPDGHYALTYQGDGNLVEYDVWNGWYPLWSSRTAGTSPGYAVMQGDGNFVIYNAAGSAVWHTNTWMHAGATLHVQNDGNVVLYSSSGAVWARTW